MNIRLTIRRMAMVCAGAMVIVPLSAGAASAQSAEDCDGLEAIPGIGEPLAEGCRDFAEQVGGDDEDDENGDEGSPLDDLLGALEDQGLDPDQLCALREEAPEEFDAILDAFGPVIDELCPPEEEPEEEEDPDPQPEPATPDAEDEDDTTDADTSGELPRTGGLAGLAGLGLLGAGVGLRRLRDGDDPTSD